LGLQSANFCVYQVLFREVPFLPSTELGDHRRHHDHQHVGAEIEQMQGDEQIDARSGRPDARDQVARLVLAEEGHRQLLDLLEDAVAQAEQDAMQRLFDRVAVWNFEGTAAFKDAVERTREVVSGLTAADLRAREGLRDQVRSEMVELLGLFREVSGAMRADAPEAAVPA
jgi:hypothetical protein